MYHLVAPCYTTVAFYYQIMIYTISPHHAFPGPITTIYDNI